MSWRLIKSPSKEPLTEIITLAEAAILFTQNKACLCRARSSRILRIQQEHFPTASCQSHSWNTGVEKQNETYGCPLEIQHVSGAFFYGSPLSSHSAECPSALWNSAYRMKLGSCWILITIVKYKSLQYKCIPLVLHPLSLRLTIFCEILVKLSITWDLIIVWSNSCEMSYSLSLKINKNANYCKSSHIRDQGCEHLGLYAWIANCIVLWIKTKSNGPLMI